MKHNIPLQTCFIDGKPYFTYYWREDIPEDLRKEYNNRGTCDTCPVIPEHPDKSAIYSWDLDNWYNWKYNKAAKPVWD